MKKISAARKLFGVTATATLAELKSIYRSKVKEHHPDKYAPGSPEHDAAEHLSKDIISAYHFLVSIAPETKAAGLAAYTASAASSAITKIDYDKELLEITFADGSSYEYFGVPKATYEKLVHAPSPTRFARRHIVQAFVYRQATKKDLVDVGG